MQSGRLYNKQLTTTEGTNLTDSSSQAFKHVDVANIPTTSSNNLQYSGEDDSQTVLSGAGGGDSDVSEPQTAPVRWGYNAPSGSRVEINDTQGSERIEIVHRSGAGAVIEPDGSIYLVSQSARGAGVAAPLGDIYITAGGQIVIKGAANMTIQTSGDVDFDIGGTFNVKCENYNLITQNKNEIIDGSSSTSITNDKSEIIGGIDRLSVAGDMREQVSGNRIYDVGGNNTARIGGDNSNDVSGMSTHKINGDHTLSSQGSTKVLSNSDLEIDTGSDMAIRTGGEAKIGTGGIHFVHAAGGYEVGSGGNLAIAADGSALFGSNDITAVIGSDTQVLGDAAVTVGTTGEARLIGSTASVSGSTVELKAGVVNGPIPTGSAGSPDSVSPNPLPPIPAPDGPNSAEAAQDAQVMEAPDIVDTLTSARQFPEYPGNGVLEGANGTGYGMISHDTTPQAEDVFNAYSSGNQGNINPSYSGGSYDNLPDTPVNRDPNIKAHQYDVPTPSQYDVKAKISKYFTLGMLTKAKHSHRIPPGIYQDVVKQHILLANNVLDPIKEKFPDLVITSAYRSNSSNHRTGRAIDIVVESRSMSKHAEIARFARDNLPVDQVFLERNTSGRTHVHLRVSTAGKSGNPSVLTCGDPQCRSRVAGINVEYLVRRG